MQQKLQNLHEIQSFYGNKDSSAILPGNMVLWNICNLSYH